MLTFIIIKIFFFECLRINELDLKVNQKYDSWQFLLFAFNLKIHCDLCLHRTIFYAESNTIGRDIFDSIYQGWQEESLAIGVTYFIKCNNAYVNAATFDTVQSVLR